MSALTQGRRHRRRWRYGLATFAAVALATLSVAAIAAAAQASSIIVTNSPSNFESGDGNMVLDTSGNTDWNCFVGTDGFQSGTAPTGCKVTSGAIDVTADATGELSLKSGTKFDITCPVIITGSSPNKDEFTNVASFSDTNSSTGDVYFYGAQIRSTANGNSSGNIELDQTTTGCRVAGDKLLAFDFVSGGTTLSLHLLTWVTSGTCFVSHDSAPCWGSNVETLDPSLFNGLSNQAAIAAGDNGISGVALDVNQFAEFGTNLSQALFASGLPVGGCFAFPREAWMSRSSGSSFTSNPEDIEIESSTIASCGAFGVSKVSTKGGNLAGASFSVANSSGTVVATGTTDSTGTVCFSSIKAGTYKVTETAPPKGYAIDTTSQNVTVSTSSTCSNDSLTFKDTPLTDLTVTATSEATGGTTSTVTCVVGTSTTNIGDSPQSGGSATVTATGLVPGTYTCTVVIDP